MAPRSKELTGLEGVQLLSGAGIADFATAAQAQKLIFKEQQKRTGAVLPPRTMPVTTFLAMSKELITKVKGSVP